jgi:UDP-N-acetylmuramyl pentapeptide phosphotransferase/UDP-N-acetylglucosamine-1-phosphate transferase
MTFLFIFILLFVAELAYFRVSDHFNIIDKPNQRSSHTSITLRGGGIVFYIGILLYFIFEGFQYPGFFLGLTLISFISFADDIKPRSPKIRLLVHFVSMGLMFYQWGLFSSAWYYALIALVICTGILNAYNFMDGINGITGGYSLVVAGTLCYINNYRIAFVDHNLLYCLILALLVFNFFNFRKKAKCFAGDVGSISVAFILVFLLGLLILKTNDFSYIILLAVYGVETILTIIHRLILRENIFEAHRKHVYQLLANELKLPHLLVSSIYMALQSLIVIGYLFAYDRSIYLIVVLAALSVLYVFIKSKFYYLHSSK